MNLGFSCKLIDLSDCVHTRLVGSGQMKSNYYPSPISNQPKQKLSMSLMTFQLEPNLCLNPAYDIINTQPKSTLRPKLGPTSPIIPIPNLVRAGRPIIYSPFFDPKSLSPKFNQAQSSRTNQAITLSSSMPQQWFKKI